MRNARWTVVATLAVVVMVGGCGSESADEETADAKASTTTGAAEKPVKATAPQGTLLERAAGTWKSIATPRDTSLDTLVIEDGKVTAEGAKLSCTGTLVPVENDGEESATVTYTCLRGDDGGRGLGHLKVKPDGSALVIGFDGPAGGWGGPVDSYRRA
ncbi:hypothetical protein [Streptomyces sp. NPDC093594]|uniref:hypothetical protein n=1 Tax=Streptomyces sp. NPDC093594 TaxID=3155305 RepID=UPI00344FA06C